MHRSFQGQGTEFRNATVLTRSFSSVSPPRREIEKVPYDRREDHTSYCMKSNSLCFLNTYCTAVVVAAALPLSSVHIICYRASSGSVLSHTTRTNSSEARGTSSNRNIIRYHMNIECVCSKLCCHVPQHQRSVPAIAICLASKLSPFATVGRLDGCIEWPYRNRNMWWLLLPPSS